jgi:DNA (cytosine-5)-methyltransferase 1
MIHASLFSGIGGFDLAAEWMGWENLFHCEWNPFGQQVLKHHFPNSISYNDITKTDFSIHRGQVDILTGGFPCQPYSAAGKRLGTEDERHLWPEMLRTIQEVQPRWVVGENVLGLTNWNGGLVFQEVQTDLEAKGYEVQAYVLPACAKNAPHRRDRVWFVAYSNINGLHKFNSNNEIKSTDRRINAFSNSNKSIDDGIIANSEFLRLEHGKKRRDINESQRKTQSKGSISASKFEANGWSRFPTFSPVCGGDDGISRELDNITFSKWRKESIKAYGNAIVPQVAYEIFKAIEEFELMVNK